MARPHIIITGGGFSGTALAIHLARQSSSPLLITVVEPREQLGGGVAYSTQEPAHRINVPASRMQLSGDEQGAFDRWYRQQPECSLDSVAHCNDGSVYPQRGMVGRRLIYGTFRPVLLHGKGSNSYSAMARCYRAMCWR